MRSFSNYRIIFCFLFTSVACLNLPLLGQPQGQRLFQNPVLNQDFPDPSVLKASDGWIYAYGTQSKVDGKMVNIQVAKSKDLVHWKYLGDALPEKPAWADKTQDFWAPHVIYDEGQGKYYLYFSSTQNAERGHCIGVAVSSSPAGPYKDAGKPVVCGKSFINIDPMAFDDPQSGQKLLYWGSGSKAIKVQQLADNRLAFSKNSKPKKLIPPDVDSDYNTLVEGAWVTYKNSYYYLFFSGDNCCGKKAHYAVMVARSRQATGPFTPFGTDNGTGSSVILKKSDKWLAPGHNSILEDNLGNGWIIYHAISRKNFMGRQKRVMLIDRIVYVDGWPRVEYDHPSDTYNMAPYFISEEK